LFCTGTDMTIRREDTHLLAPGVDDNTSSLAVLSPV
jgi:hypothetical protein